MTSIFDFPLIYRELWACYEFFRRCGFVPDNIYAIITDEGKVQCSVKHLGKEAAITIGRIVGFDRDREEKKWIELSGLVNDGTIPESELQQVWDTSQIKKNMASVLANMHIIGCPPIRDFNPDGDGILPKPN
jgi:hypothetical protein